MTYYSQPEAFAGSQWPLNSQSTALQQFLYAFPKPRLSGRISKPRSAGNSPSASRRRTTTVHSSPMYRQPTQEQQIDLNAALLAAINRKRARPMSWHPVLNQLEYGTPAQFYPTTSLDSYNLPVTQVTQPSQTMTGAFDETMLQPFPAADVSNMQQDLAFSQLPQEPYLQVNQPQVDGTFWDGSEMGVPSFAQPLNDWPLDMTSINQDLPSMGAPASNYGSVSSPGPATPDFLPIQQFGDDAESVPAFEKPEPGDELVGMGLYSEPDASTDGLVYGMNGKGLKLEETFTPSAEKDDEEEEEDQQEPDSESDNQQQSPQANKQAESMVNKSFFFESDDGFEQPTMARPSFNFPTTSCMNYGYGWI
ncbi:uncharacterized protein BDW70DRAFT_142293 [Aspergillus foveolatus]|uniref:uncharacterized protein n=1 Tax=Aspergillus foveolatus TaxID=210207 RepID=UPI003CCCA837